MSEETITRVSQNPARIVLQISELETDIPKMEAGIVRKQEKLEEMRDRKIKLENRLAELGGIENCQETAAKILATKEAELAALRETFGL